MLSRLVTELGAYYAIHGHSDVVVQYGPTTHSEYRFPTHSKVLRWHSATLEREFTSGIHRVGSAITIPHDNVQAVEDMLRYFYLEHYDPLPPPAGTPSLLQAFNLLLAQHHATHDLARQKHYRAIRFFAFANAQFQITIDAMLDWLDMPEHSTALNAVRLLRMFVGQIYDENDDTWVKFLGDEVQHWTEWPLRVLVCEGVARIWVREQRWNETLTDDAIVDALVDDEAEDGDEAGFDIEDGDTGEDVVKRALEKLCWNNTRFSRDFATWMFRKGEVSITLGHDVMRRTRFA